MFAERGEAGRLLAEKLLFLRPKQSLLVLAIPRGGVVIGKIIADTLKIPLGVIYAKKIPTPGQPELAAGARMVRTRKFGPTPEVRGKEVILTDDGIATGETVRAAIIYLKKKRAKKIILAVPVSPKDSLKKIKPLVDKAIVLQTPRFFSAVGEFYLKFPQVTDKEVLQLLQP